ncbi:MAG TPA: SDR family NAD(P)-dependent oxidoreductase, partial [Candidatus Dormibacteraeota bacterium]
MTGWRDLTFAGRTAVVTGAARGIGRAVAHRLAGLGARAVIWDVDGEEAERAASELAAALRDHGRPHELAWRRVDVTDATAVAEALGDCGGGGDGAGLDVLVNNAGTTTVQETAGMPLEEWERILRVNLHGTFLCCRAAIPHLRRRPGSAIVNISSSSALVGGG